MGDVSLFLSKSAVTLNLGAFVYIDPVRGCIGEGQRLESGSCTLTNLSASAEAAVRTGSFSSAKSAPYPNKQHNLKAIVVFSCLYSLLTPRQVKIYALTLHKRSL